MSNGLFLALWFMAGVLLGFFRHFVTGGRN
mgnify:FL=1